MGKILIIEDDPFVQRMYQRIFTHKNFDIEMASNGTDGLSLAEEKKPDLILLDIMLPDLNGIEVLKKLKANVKTKHIKVLVLSNINDDDTQKQAKAAGAHGYLVKADYSPEKLIESVEKELGN